MEQREFLKRKEAAELLGLTEQTLANWAWKGEGPPAIAINSRCIRYHRATLLEWARSHTVTPGAQAA